MTPGTQLGSYEILSPLGKGGMGEVWRARDSKLGREVAIKTLPEEFAKDEERLARFEREAKLLASLNHPNIAAIYGLEEHEGTRFLVLELVEGDTLAERLKRGAIPVEETLTLALQIAEALEAAHEKGVIHRDLKPANIKVTPEGKIKVLDFGLAKAFAGDGSGVNLSQSPTLSMAATQQGVILGTAAYMSPEQARGVTVDKRADIWAFGCVLYEMLSGRQVFKGELMSDVMASVLKSDPDYKGLPPTIHPKLRDLLRRCLEKEPKQRWHDVGDVRVEIEQLLADPESNVAWEAEAAPSSRRSFNRVVVVATFLLTVAVTSVATWMIKPGAPSRLARYTIALPEADELLNGGRNMVSVSPDGSMVAYTGGLRGSADNTESQIYLRRIDNLEPTPVSGTENGGRRPFFSPGGEWLAFWSGPSTNKLMKVSVSGGAPIPLCDSDNFWGASWGPDDMIVFGQVDGIFQVSANGGESELLVSPQGSEVLSGPQILPGGEWLLFTTTTATGPDRWDKAQVVVQSLESNERKVVIPTGSDGRWVPTGHIVHSLGNVLFATAFDLASLKVVGGTVSVVEGMRRADNPQDQPATSHFGISDDGKLVYVDDSTIVGGSVLATIDSSENIERFDNVPQRRYLRPRVSPDGTKIAVESLDNGGTIWIYDIDGGSAMRPLTVEGGDSRPVWIENGDSVAFTSDRNGARSIFRKQADGSGVAQQLTFAEEGAQHRADSWSPDGFLSFTVVRSGDYAIWVLANVDGAEPEQLLDPLEGGARASSFSPDGEWLAYNWDPTGQAEVYVTPFPSDGTKYRVAQNAFWSSWSNDGSELFFMSGGRLSSVDVRTAPGFSFRGLRSFDTPLPTVAQMYYPMPSGERFAVVFPPLEAGVTAQHITVVQDWFEELKQRVPVP